IRRVRLIDDMVWVVSESSVVGYALNENTLEQRHRIPLLGANDVDQLNDTDLAIVGSFGRAVYRLGSESSLAGNFVATHREPGRLELAATDGQHILAGSAEGLWLYLINARTELTQRQFESPPPPPARRAATIAAQ